MVLPIAAVKIAGFKGKDQRAAQRAVGGLSINMTSNASQVQKAMQGLSKQLPFAMSQALNSTAFDIRKQIVDRTYPQSFNVKNKRFANAMFRVEKASKRKLSAAVFDRLGKDYMAMQAEGGTKLPRGRNIAIPGRANQRTSTGKIPRARQPRQIIASGKAYKTTLRGGQQAIVQPQGRGKVKRLKVMYVLEQTARIPKRFDFYEDANTVSRRKFDKNFSKAFARAKATAKRR